MTEKERRRYAKSKKSVEPIPDEFTTLVEASDFWDTHDISDYWNKTKEVKFQVRLKKNRNMLLLKRNLQKSF